jgi:microcystin-dependent protein
MSQPFIGELRVVGFDFAPLDWAVCDGSLLPIAQYTALFSLLGTQFGGDGQTTFGLPDLQGRMPMGQGQGPGLSAYTVGELSGQEDHTLTTNEIPQHNHSMQATSGLANSVNPNAGRFAKPDISSRLQTLYGGDGSATSPMVGPTGGSLPHENRQPILTNLIIIALEGIFPPRN